MKIGIIFGGSSVEHDISLITASQIMACLEGGKNDIIPIKDILDIKQVELTSDIEKKVLNGVKINNIYNEKEILFTKNKKEIALYKKDENSKLMKLDKMFEGGNIWR